MNKIKILFDYFVNESYFANEKVILDLVNKGFTIDELKTYVDNVSLITTVEDYLHLLDKAYENYKRIWLKEHTEGMYVCKKEFEDNEWKEADIVERYLSKEDFVSFLSLPEELF